MPLVSFSFFFFFNDTATTEIYTLSLHDALPICIDRVEGEAGLTRTAETGDYSQSITRNFDVDVFQVVLSRDRKSTRLNSSHGYISYAVFCLKKKKKRRPPNEIP